MVFERTEVEKQGQTAPGQSASTGANQGGDVPEKSRRDARIDQLVAERETFKKQLFEMQGKSQQQIEELQSELARIKSDKEGQGKQVRSWSDLSDSALQSMIQENADNPAMFAAGVEELVRRRVDGAVGGVLNKVKTEQASDAYKQNVYGRIVSDFGDEAKNPSSDLYRRADGYYAQLREAYVNMYGKDGADLLRKNPEAEYACFARAHKELMAPELQALREERDKRKQFEAMELGGRSSGAKSADIKQKLAKGDIRGAIKSLGVVPKME